MKDKVFVYGTLMSGFDNEFAKILHQYLRKSVSAKIRGVLYVQKNWSFPYPVADYQPESNNFIFGELLFLDLKKDLERLYNFLDEYEGVDMKNPEHGEYLRKMVTVTWEENQEEARQESAWCYVNNKYPVILERIPHGDFRKYLES